MQRKTYLKSIVKELISESGEDMFETLASKDNEELAAVTSPVFTEEVLESANSSGMAHLNTVRLQKQ